MSKNGGVIGVSDHGGWAVLVTARGDGTVLDRRRVDLVDEALPSIPHHHEAQLLPIDEGVALVERVRVSAGKHAVRALDSVAIAVPNVIGIALRTCPPLPRTIAERIRDYRARNVADWIMYREALAAAARSHDWPVYWYDTKTVFNAASHLLRVESLDARFQQLRQAMGPPWNHDHKLAMSAAVVAASSISVSTTRAPRG